MIKNINNMIFKTTAVLSLGITLNSCDLDLLPEDSLSPDTYFTSSANLELWTNRFYTMLDNADVSSKNADDVIDRTPEDLIVGTRSASTETGWNWEQLRLINQYLQYSVNCTDESARKQYDGTAHFFRAYFYFVKVRRYGDVPYYEQVLDSDNAESLTKPRDDRGFVMDKVMEEFDLAINMLPTNKSISRVTKWSALAFKARAALYEGTFRKYHGLNDADKYLTIAAEAAKKFIDNSGYSIYKSGNEPYRELFYSDVAKSDEVILARIYNDDLKVAHSIPHTIKSLAQGFTKRFMNHYLMADGTFFSSQDNYGKKLFIEEVVNRDPRLAQTVLTPGYIQIGETKTTINDLSSVTGYRPIKFVAETEYDGSDKAVSDFPIIRTAEVYLIYAEAMAELGTITQSDLDMSVNKIRARVGMPNIKLDMANNNIDPLMTEYYPNVTKSPNTGIILEIRRERTIELTMEGHRVWDMLRWKEGAQMTNKLNPYLGCYFTGAGTYDMDNDGNDDLELFSNQPTSSVSVKKGIGTDIVLSNNTFGNVVAFSQIEYSWNENRDYLWPIPANQRVITSGQLTQNKGWDDGLSF